MPTSSDHTDSNDAASGKPKKACKQKKMPLSGAVKDSAQQIWQAGLGAFSKAQAEGAKAFEALAKEGADLQRKTQLMAEVVISEATHKMSSVAADISSKAAASGDKLESYFEDRVAKIIGKLDLATSKEIKDLTASVESLQQTVKNLSAVQSPVVAQQVASDLSAPAPETPLAPTPEPAPPVDAAKPATQKLVEDAAPPKAARKTTSKKPTTPE